MAHNRRLRSVAAISMMLASTSTWSGNASVPVQLNVGIGGFLGPSYRVELVSGLLVCTETRRGKQVSTHQAQVTPAGWMAFRSELDRLNVWSWRGSYFNSTVSDGTQCVCESLIRIDRSQARGATASQEPAGCRIRVLSGQPHFLSSLHRSPTLCPAAICRLRLDASHLRMRANSWQSPARPSVAQESERLLGCRHR